MRQYSLDHNITQSQIYLILVEIKYQIGQVISIGHICISTTSIPIFITNFDNYFRIIFWHIFTIYIIRF